MTSLHCTLPLCPLVLQMMASPHRLTLPSTPRSLHLHLHLIYQEIHVALMISAPETAEGPSMLEMLLH